MRRMKDDEDEREKDHVDDVPVVLSRHEGINKRPATRYLTRYTGLSLPFVSLDEASFISTSLFPCLLCVVRQSLSPRVQEKFLSLVYSKPKSHPLFQLHFMSIEYP